MHMLISEILAKKYFCLGKVVEQTERRCFDDTLSAVSVNTINCSASLHVRSSFLAPKVVILINILCLFQGTTELRSSGLRLFGSAIMVRWHHGLHASFPRAS